MFRILIYHIPNNPEIQEYDTLDDAIAAMHVAKYNMGNDAGTIELCIVIRDI